MLSAAVALYDHRSNSACLFRHQPEQPAMYHRHTDAAYGSERYRLGKYQLVVLAYALNLIGYCHPTLPRAEATRLWSSSPCRRLQLWSSSPCRRLQLWSSSLAAGFSYGHHPLAAGFSYGHHPLAAGLSYGHHPLAAGFSLRRVGHLINQHPSRHRSTSAWRLPTIPAHQPGSVRPWFGLVGSEYAPSPQNVF